MSSGLRRIRFVMGGRLEVALGAQLLGICNVNTPHANKYQRVTASTIPGPH